MTRVEKVQALAKEKGHCVCSKEFACPCKCFKAIYRCHCAGEDTGMRMEGWIEFNKN